MNESPKPEASFDSCARRYEEELGKGLAVSGESRDYFCRGRVEWLSRRLREIDRRISTVLDFGCGTGDAVPHLLGHRHAVRVVGVDVSRGSLQVAVT